MAGGVVHIPWYATVFRGDDLERALQQIAPLAQRFGASEYAIYRSRDDPYRLLQMGTFAEKADFERYWYGEEFSLWRGDYSSFYQVPILYVWHDLVERGGVAFAAEVANGAESG
jgi:hypothetical protein